MWGRNLIFISHGCGLTCPARRRRTCSWYSTNPLELSRQFGGIWKTDEFQAGDALVFTMRSVGRPVVTARSLLASVQCPHSSPARLPVLRSTFHMSSCNQTDRVRVSCDTRYALGHPGLFRLLGAF